MLERFVHHNGHSFYIWANGGPRRPRQGESARTTAAKERRINMASLLRVGGSRCADRAREPFFASVTCEEFRADDE
jgi:hypothetical protein